MPSFSFLNVSEGQRSFVMSETNFNWYAVYTIPRWEKKVAKILDESGIENYCPMKRVVKQWSDRKKLVTEPVFKSYVFVKIAENTKWSIKQVRGILNFVYWLGKPAKIREDEILTIKKFLNEFENVSVDENKIVSKAKVKIEKGVLMNYEGLVVEVQGKNAIVRIESLGVMLTASFEKKNLLPI